MSASEAQVIYFTKNNNKHNEKNEALDTLCQLHKKALMTFDDIGYNSDLNFDEYIILEEADITINELRNLIIKISDKESYTTEWLVKHIHSFLKNRNQRIKLSSISYTDMPQGFINQLCLDIARIANELDPSLSIYQYLMGLTEVDDIEEFDEEDKLCVDQIPLDNLIMRDSGLGVIPAQTFYRIEPGQCKQEQLFPRFAMPGENLAPLTENELHRLAQHSDSSKKLAGLYSKIEKEKLSCDSLGGNIYQLIQALRDGGASGGNGGSEEIEGIDASMGIIRFFKYWYNFLSEKERSDYRPLYSIDKEQSLGIILDVLENKNKHYHNCVEVNANKLNSILLAHENKLYSFSSNHYLKGLELLFKKEKKLVEIGMPGKDQHPMTFNLIAHVFKQHKLKQGFVYFLKSAYSDESSLDMDEVSIITSEIVKCDDCPRDLLTQDDDIGLTAFYHAIHAGDIETVRVLIESPLYNSSIINGYNFYDQPLLSKAIDENKKSIAKLIINHHFCNTQTMGIQDANQRKTSLAYAIDKGFSDIVSCMLNRNICDTWVLSLSDHLGFTPLLQSIHHGKKNISQLIIKSKHCKSSVLNAKNHQGNTALHQAILQNNQNTALAIIKSPFCNYAVLQATNTQGHNALYMALMCDNVWVFLSILQSKHCRPELLHDKTSGKSLLISAISHKRVKLSIIMSIVRNKHSSYKKYDSQLSEKCFLIWAIKNGHTEIAEAFLNGSQINSEIFNYKDKDGFNCLEYAVMNNNLELAQLILKNKFCTSAIMQNSQAVEQLFKAALERNNIPMAQALMESKHNNYAIFDKKSFTIEDYFIWSIKICFNDLSRAIINGSQIAIDAESLLNIHQRIKILEPYSQNKALRLLNQNNIFLQELLKKQISDYIAMRRKDPEYPFKYFTLFQYSATQQITAAEHMLSLIEGNIKIPFYLKSDIALFSSGGLGKILNNFITCGRASTLCGREVKTIKAFVACLRDKSAKLDPSPFLFFSQPSLNPAIPFDLETNNNNPLVLEPSKLLI